MRGVLADRLTAAFGLYDSLLDVLDTEALDRRLGELPSNTIGQQLWCVTGARESYARAIGGGSWAGFRCSLSAEDVADPDRIRSALRSAADAVLVALEEATDGSRDRLALELLEHEAQHHGQLIRYLYGLRLPIPADWKGRYALE